MSLMDVFSPRIAKVAFACATAVELAACGAVPNSGAVVNGIIRRDTMDLRREGARAGAGMTEGLIYGGVQCVATFGRNCQPTSQLEWEQQQIDARIRARNACRAQGTCSSAIDGEGSVDLGFTPEP